ncbi:hypothetical protein WJX79_003321 [Trebouxia sp. C0005]
MKVHRMKAFSFIRSSLAGGCYQGSGPKPEEVASGFIPKVPSLLFDLELEDGSTAFAENQEDAGAPTVAAHIRSLTEPRSQEECQLASHMQLVQRLLIESGERQGLDVFEVAEGLRRLGHAVTIRSALGGGGGNECLRNLRHRFLTCRMQGTQGHTLDSRTPSLPQDLPPPAIRHHLGGPGHGHLQRHSTNNAWPARRHGATARVSLDEGSRKGRVSLDEGSRRKASESSNTTVAAPRGATPPAGVVATVQQSINALSRKTSFNSVNHAVHLV